MADRVLREGDRVTGSGVVCDGAIVWDGESVAVEAPALSVGDRVSWREKATVERTFGRVLAVDPDETIPGGAYVWIRQDGKWPRLTMFAAELRRHD